MSGGGPFRRVSYHTLERRPPCKRWKRGSLYCFVGPSPSRLLRVKLYTTYYFPHLTDSSLLLSKGRFPHLFSVSRHLPNLSNYTFNSPTKFDLVLIFLSPYTGELKTGEDPKRTTIRETLLLNMSSVKEPTLVLLRGTHLVTLSQKTQEE